MRALDHEHTRSCAVRMCACPHAHIYCTALRLNPGEYRSCVSLRSYVSTSTRTSRVTILHVRSAREARAPPTRIPRWAYSTYILPYICKTRYGTVYRRNGIQILLAHSTRTSPRGNPNALNIIMLIKAKDWVAFEQKFRSIASSQGFDYVLQDKEFEPTS